MVRKVQITMHPITAVRVAVVDPPNVPPSSEKRLTNVEVSPAKPVDIPGEKRLWYNHSYFLSLPWRHQR